MPGELERNGLRWRERLAAHRVATHRNEVDRQGRTAKQCSRRRSKAPQWQERTAKQGSVSHSNGLHWQESTA